MRPIDRNHLRRRLPVRRVGERLTPLDVFPTDCRRPLVRQDDAVRERFGAVGWILRNRHIQHERQKRDDDEPFH